MISVFDTQPVILEEKDGHVLTDGQQKRSAV